jgi:hypothetical protein
MQLLTISSDHATNTLRDKYVSGNVAGQPVEPLRGAEFLGIVESAGNQSKAVSGGQRKDVRKESFYTNRSFDGAFSQASGSDPRSPVSVAESVSPYGPVSPSDFPSPPSRTS